MRVMIFGATGMIGQGVLRECLLDGRVSEVLTLGRSATGQVHAKLTELAVPDMLDLSAVRDQLAGFDACFFCLGVSSVGMSEPAYRRVTYDLTVSIAQTLVELNPDMTFVYVSGAGTDSSERGRLMWARVKGAAENAVLALPWQGYAVRPGFVQPLHGVRSRTGWYRAIYTVIRPLASVVVRFAPGAATTTDRLGRAMIQLAATGSPKRILESKDINELADASVS